MSGEYAILSVSLALGAGVLFLRTLPYRRILHANVKYQKATKPYWTVVDETRVTDSFLALEHAIAREQARQETHSSTPTGSGGHERAERREREWYPDHDTTFTNH
jgi:hypothetical protein